MSIDVIKDGSRAGSLIETMSMLDRNSCVDFDLTCLAN